MRIGLSTRRVCPRVVSQTRVALAVCFLLLLALCPPSAAFADDGANGDTVDVAGTLKKWHPITVSFTGPYASETDVSPNPFLDYRLQVKFTGPSGQTYNVPGFFDGNGSGGSAGDLWRVRFSPDEAGTWSY